MALENVMRVDGGHIVTGGGAGGSSVEIDWEDWCELTPEEQENGIYDIVNCPWADGTVSIDLMTKLWENPSPSSSFAAQDVTLSSNDYDYLLFIGSNVGNTKTMASGIVEKGKSGYLCLSTYESIKVAYLGRDITCVNNTKYNIGDCLYVTGASSAVQNTYMVPVIIYGIKLTASVKINAIAMDVSTSADKCMLSENESVKDRITANDVYNRVSLAGYTVNNKYTCPTDGYVFLVNNSDKDGYLSIDELVSIGMGKGRFSTFVRKGTQVWNIGTPDYVYFASIR